MEVGTAVDVGWGVEVGAGVEVGSGVEVGASVVTGVDVGTNEVGASVRPQEAKLIARTDITIMVRCFTGRLLNCANR